MASFECEIWYNNVFVNKYYEIHYSITESILFCQQMVISAYSTQYFSTLYTRGYSFDEDITIIYHVDTSTSRTIIDIEILINRGITITIDQRKTYILTYSNGITTHYIN